MPRKRFIDAHKAGRFHGRWRQARKKPLGQAGLGIVEGEKGGIALGRVHGRDPSKLTNV